MPLAQNELEILQVRKLIQCVREKDTTQISKLIESGIPNLIDYQDPANGTTALHVAVSVNLEHIVTLLLEHGASSTVQDSEGCTALMRACEYGHFQSLEALSMKSLSLQVADGKGLKALFHCLHPTGRHVKCLYFLLEYGADPNTKSAAGLPIVCAASERGLDQHLDKLLAKGADPNAREPSLGKPAVVLATEGGHANCLKLLATCNANLNAVYGEAELTALHRAASLGWFECIQILSAYGANFSKIGSNGDNAVHLATVAYRLLCVRMLGQRGCPTNDSNKEGQTPQKIAKTEGMKDAMKELKKLTVYQDKAAKGGKPKGFAEPWCIRLFDWLQVNRTSLWEMLKSCEENRDSVLPVAVFRSTLETLEVPLLEEEWTKLVKVYDKKGEGFLNWDDLLTDHKYVHAQFKLGPDDDIKGKGKKGKKKKGGKKKGGKKGKTKILFPIYFEAERPPVAGVADGYIEKDECLTDYQRFSSESPLPHSLIDDSLWYLMPTERSYINLYEAIRHGDFNSMEAAFSSGISPNARDKFNKTPLMIACAHGRCDVVRYILDKGADVNAIDNFMWTPLHHACHAGEETVVRLLLDSGANLDKQSYNGGTALMRAIESSQRPIVKLLLEKGAKLSPENKHGDTALEIAKNWGDEIIYAMVYTVAARQQAPASDAKKDKKTKEAQKGKKGGKKGKGDDGPAATIPGPPIVPLPSPSHLPQPMESLRESRKQYSLTSLQAETVVKPVSSPRPRLAWTSDMVSPRTFHNEKQKAREERGIEVTDFGETRTPFQIQIIARAQSLEMSVDL